MIALVALFAGLVIAGIIGSVFAYRYVNYSWLQYALTGLVISLPFEQFPSVSVAGGTIRISQILVILSVYLVILLVIKKDPRVTQTKLNFFFFTTLAFFVSSIPSWFNVLDSKRFLITLIPTVLVFLSAILLSQFLENPYRAIKLLYISLGISCIFAIYQFVGDMIGLPPELTLLSERYTKIVFGFPRVHSTAIEPLYFAGMLFLPIIAFFVYWISHTDSVPFFKIPPQFKNIALLGFYSVFLIATISKSAIAIAVLVIGLILLLWLFKYPTLKTATDVVSLSVAGIVSLYLLILYFPSFNQWVSITINHVIDTVSGQSTSIQERGIFLESAQKLLPDHIITGIGSGQYGVAGKHLLRFLPKQKDGGLYIVNNTYVEVLLEYGLVPFVVFVGTLGTLIYKGLRTLYTESSWLEDRPLHILILTFSLLAYFLQWATFSPIYIMPIFIQIGLLLNLIFIQKAESSQSALSENLKARIA